MNSNWTRALGGAVALVLVLAALSCRRQPLEINVKPATDRAYRLSLVTTVVPPGQGQIERTSIEGVLNVRALVDGGTRILGCELSQLDVRRNGKPAPSVAKAMSAPFAVELAAAGRFGQSRFLPETSRAERASLEGLVRSLEIALPAQRVARWESPGRDGSGDYLASYVLADAKMITRNKLRYTSVREAGWVSLNVVASTLVAKLDPELWLQSAQFQEKLEIRGQGQMAATVEVEMQMQPLADRPAFSLVLMQQRIQAKLTSPREDPTAPSASAWDELAQAEHREEFLKAGVTLEVLLGRIAKPDLPRTTLLLQVSAYIQAFPEQTKVLAAQMGSLPDAGAELLRDAVVMAGTAQAEEAVLDLLGKQSARKERMRLLQALATAPNASPRLAEAILALLDGGRAENFWEDAMAAARTLNLLGMRKGPAQGTIARGLQERLSQAERPREQQMLLQALQGGEPPLPLSEATRYLKSQTLEVRVAAAELLARSSEPAAVPAFEAVLADETDAQLRRAAIAALANGLPSERLSAIAARLLADNSFVDARARAGLIQYLARGMPSVPGNRARLEALLKQETSRPLLALILNALSDDANAARPR